ncbi:hypothetical protein [Sedimenticola selenatireducens]|uniref:Uncharacterized protein n=1 Tax=Sedimenticola selenatireducens TaxID=191960 RepID=A0A2N6CT22_9GAMM|nr:hypothetical protein [Sedimenticola selenatireducens]PLX60268.1 MAG: hypothetical protein C0630_15835 [Sedimenticola selenatireducens]
MATVDIPVPKKLQEALSAPKCIDLSLPEPSKLEINLPSGGSLTALVDAGKSIPNDCSLTFSLMLQVMPLMASMTCVLKILKLIKPLSDAITSPPPTPGVIKDIAEAVADLAPCFLMLTPAGMIPFVRDILCLILKILNCLIGQLKTIANILGGLTVQLETARAKGDEEQIATLECAQQNVMTSMAGLFQSVEPVMVLMDIASPFMSIAGVAAIQMPALGSASDMEALNQAISTLDEVVGTIQGVVDGLGGCPA